MRNSLGQRLGKQIELTKADALEANKCLRLQTRAWRVCTLIALVDQKRGVETARWLFMVSVPFVNGPAVEGFLDREEKKAEELTGESACPTQTGTFGS